MNLGSQLLQTVSNNCTASLLYLWPFEPLCTADWTSTGLVPWARVMVAVVEDGWRVIGWRGFLVEDCWEEEVVVSCCVFLALPTGSWGFTVVCTGSGWSGAWEGNGWLDFVMCVSGGGWWDPASFTVVGKMVMVAQRLSFSPITCYKKSTVSCVVLLSLAWDMFDNLYPSFQLAFL